MAMPDEKLEQNNKEYPRPANWRPNTTEKVSKFENLNNASPSFFKLHWNFI